MRIEGKSVLITGAGHGIGAALALRLAAEKPRGIVVSDIDEPAAKEVAELVCQQGVPGVGVRADVSSADEVTELIATTEREIGPLDVICSNAGISTAKGLFATPADWERAWGVNVAAHIHLAQAALPGMVRRKEGYFLITASAVGLLGLQGDAPYSVSKHAAVGFAEWLAFTYRPRGIRVSALCPLGVRTGLLMPAVESGHAAGAAIADAGRIMEPAEVAEVVVQGFADERFLILPHPEVAEMHARKVADPDAWIAEQAAAGSRHSRQSRQSLRDRR
ncbi:MAG TPA: SDR family oxidoreductase [Pseudonocardiaceae bacterium]|jgi:NAD(P)-dependent dehydrogenase (short-subunit alcohol dehydrogenase family)|nr:SDR family oxidoreductase [Pseudonocardiaceae bacterium]